MCGPFQRIQLPGLFNDPRMAGFFFDRKKSHVAAHFKVDEEIAVVFFCLKKSLVEEIQHIQHSTWCSVVCHPLETYVKS